MSNVINLNAETGANYIGDDASPSVSFENSSTGSSLKVQGMVATSRSTINSITLAGGVLAAAATIAGLVFATPSAASGAIISLQGQSFVSAVSLIFAASANWAGMGAIRVVRSDGTFGWIPVLPSAQVTAAAVE